MKIAIVFGGASFEHEISIVSAIALKDVLKKSDLAFIFVDSQREWYLIPKEAMKSKLFSSGEYKKYPSLFLKQGGFYQKALLKEKKIGCDVVLNLIHGGDGEDGKMASLFDFFGIPYIGPRIEASVLSFNKHLTKLLANELGIKTLPYQMVHKNIEHTLQFDYPLIVKPARLGSSIGVGIARDKKELDYALDVAFEFDEEVLIEPFVEGVKEYNLAGCKTDNFVYSIVEEPKKEKFLDFEKKYLDFSRTERTSRAAINKDLEEKLRAAFAKIYDPLFLGSLIRCDFFVIEGEIYLNEINPIPGSMANYLFDGFEEIIWQLSSSLPKPKKIPVTYQYIHSIQAAKGK